MESKKVIEVMENAVLSAGTMLLGMQPTTKRLDARKDFLTDADLRSENMILNILTTEYPNIPSLSEEKDDQGDLEAKKGLMWIIDPIDGTINFFAKLNNWAVSIALVENGQTIAGVVYVPAEHKLFSASADSNTIMSNHYGMRLEEVKVNQDSNLKQCRTCTDWGKELHGGEDHRRAIEILGILSRHTLYPELRTGCVSTIMNVVQGKIAAFVFANPDIFDTAAAGIIVEKAGGKVTDLQGNPWTPFSGSIVASNSLIHEELLKILRE